MSELKAKKTRGLEEGLRQAKLSVDRGMTPETAYAYGFLHGARWCGKEGAELLKINSGNDVYLRELAWEISQIADEAEKEDT